VAAGAHPEQVFWSPDVETALREPAVELGAEDFVLFKASRGMALERLAEGLLAHGRQAASREDEATRQRVG